MIDIFGSIIEAFFCLLFLLVSAAPPPVMYNNIFLIVDFCENNQWVKTINYFSKTLCFYQRTAKLARFAALNLQACGTEYKPI